MLINLRNALMTGKRLPYDAEVEYLFADSRVGAYINSGILWKSSLRVKCTLARYQGTSYPLQSFFGARDVSAANAGYTLGFNTNIKFVSDNSGTRLTSSMNCEYYGIYTIDKKPNEVTISGNGQTETMTGGPSQTQRGTYPLYIFGLNNVGTAATTGMRLYSLQIWDNNVLVRDFIPVRKKTVGYLYDRVSGKLFGNAGTGYFVLGQDVVPVEWLESHGSEYIDTAVIPNNDTKVEIKFRTVNYSLYAAVAGVYGGTSDRCFYTATFLGRNNGQMKSTIGSENTAITFSAPVGTDIDLVFNDNHKLYVNGSLAGTFTETMGVQTKSMWLYAPNGYSTYKCSCKIYYAKVYDNSIPVRSYYPVRIGTDATSWEGAMMDVLTRRIYRNAGTGAFAYGNDLKYPIPAE